MAIIAPSLLSADFLNLAKDVEMVNNSQAEWLHLDIMDGRFVPNLSFGLPVVKAVSKQCQKFRDVHLMIVEPEKYFDDFIDAGAQCISFHIEASTHLHRSLSYLKAKGVKAGVAINPHTPISTLKDILYITDLVCMMSVNPGFGGQKFIERTYQRVEELKNLIIKEGATTLIEIDGGVTLDNAGKLKSLGADVLVAGNTVFGSADPISTIAQLLSA
jgi:ribulose-phosphate 3-epimerase